MNPEAPPSRRRISFHKHGHLFGHDNVQKPTKPFRYIAAQGPGEETTPIFWEMIWQQNVRVIVMLTRIVEGFGFNSVKCAMYWPELVGGVKRFSDLEVQVGVAA